MNAVTAFADPVPLAVAHPHIRFQAVTKTWPATASSAGVTALDTVTLDVAEGSITGIIGRSGAGKSTLLRAINGLERPTSGTVEVDGVDVAGLDRAGLIALRRRIGMIFQHFNLLSSRTVFDNVALPLEFAGLPKAEIAERVGRLIDLVGLADKRDRYPAELSGGQKQRVGIARALATEPKVLLSDEATSALDPETTRSILALLKRVNALTGVTIVLITHEMQVIREICDQVAVIDQGRIVEQGPVYRVFAAPQAEITRSLISSVSGVVLPASVASRLTQDRTGVRDAVVRIVFTGSNATAPILSRLSRSLDIDVNVLAGQVDEIGGQPFGQLIVSVPAREPVLGALTGLIQAHGLTAEVIGYVP